MELDEVFQKCLICQNPFCKKGCPIDTDIPKIINLCRKGEYVTAYKILMENNPLASITSRVCPHEFNCYGNCILNRKGTPIPFYKLEQDLTAKYRYEYSYKDKTGRVAIIGSGPAGLFSAIYLANHGLDVTIFEKNSYLGGILTDGIPSSRLPYEFVEEIINTLVKLNVNIIKNTKVDEGKLLELTKTFDYAILACGLSKSRTLDFKESDRIIDAISFLKDYNLARKLGYKEKYKINGKAIVLGLGNVACDAANALRHLDVNTTICYRRSQEEAPCTPMELNECINNGVTINYLLKPDSITENSRGLKVKFEKTILGEPDERGRRTPVGTNEFITLECDYLITALGQLPLENEFINVNTNSNYVVTDDNNLTNIPNLYAVGDITLGASTVVNAISSAKVACNDILSKITKE